MSNVLVTGGAGFFGSILTRRLLDAGHDCVVLDLQPCDISHPRLTAVRGDIRNRQMLAALFDRHRFETVYHCAAMLAHAVKDRKLLWESNVDGTRNIADASVQFGARSLVFTSSNCLWATNMGRPVQEQDVPAPVEIYGRSKLAGEVILSEYEDRLDVVCLRCPTIVGEGRLGLLAILFEFISEGRRVWVVGGGRNRYQFIYAEDLVDACMKAANHRRSAIFNIGSDNVTSFRETYQYVIDKAGTGATIASLPKEPTIAAMKLAHLLKVSPLGPYQYRMIAEDFIFDTALIKRELDWLPTLNNGEMLWHAYQFYWMNRDTLAQQTEVSAHRQAARMGAIRILKWVS